MSKPAPSSTYRLQLTPGFGFEEAATVTPYLARLGISHLYSSPYLQAAAGSQHGYDVVDPTRVNEELGGAPGHAALLAALGAHGLGQILDIVPNHMAVGTPANRWWWDVLEHGTSSRYASYFDVAWDPPEAKLRNTILIPVLGDHYGRELEAGRIRLGREAGRLRVAYHEHSFPVDPRSYGEALGDGFGGLAAEFAALPVVAPGDRPGAERRHREAESLVARLQGLDDYERLDAAIARLNRDPDRLDGLLERQNYRLARWQVAGEELDYRRFFDINTLAGLRMEDPTVFVETHRLVLGWLNSGSLEGVRVDHPDGLRDPEAYLRRLRAAAPGAWIVVEKILEVGERLPDTWPVDGTTGYDFMNLVLGLFVDPAAELAMTEACLRFTGEIADYHDLVHEKKHLVMRELLASDLRRLTSLFVRVCEGNRRYRDYTRRELLECLRETIACLPGYRTYTRPGEPGSVSASDRGRVEAAIAGARARRPDLDGELFGYLARLLLLEVDGEVERELVWRFQQTSGPVAAKGIEDTAFYVYNRLTALNEVGGDPARFGVGTAEFHAAAVEAAERRPAAMLATSTHDSKRSEDVRARLAVLSEVPDRWQETVRGWAGRHEPLRRDGWPDANARYLFYQTIAGAWPISAERLLAYMEKAAREAKAHTSWLAPVPEYERALRAFVVGAFADDAFLEEVAGLVAAIDGAGRVNSLAMKLLALTAPGVPDIYQGTELWSWTLVDPDNRGRVDFGERARLLDQVERLGEAAAGACLLRMDEGLPKLLVVRRALQLRAERPEAFRGAYRPLAATGSAAEHVVAFERGAQVITVVPRLTLRLAGQWGDTALALPEGSWHDRIGGRRHRGAVPLGELLGDFPVALLAREAGS